MIKPLILSKDVRHIGPEDGLASVAITNVTKALAENDSAIVDKVNELVAAIQDGEQLVTVPVARVLLPGLASAPLVNFRIPTGYQARVFNAAVSSVPVNKGVISVHHSPTFGSTGSSEGSTLAVETGTEFTAGSDFFVGGEFVISIENQNDKSVSAIGSVLVGLKRVNQA